MAEADGNEFVATDAEANAASSKAGETVAGGMAGNLPVGARLRAAREAVVLGVHERIAPQHVPAFHGFDAEKMRYGDMIELGIVDPAKVTRAGVENAASIAAMILTTESMITEIPEPASAAPPMPPMDY